MLKIDWVVGSIFACVVKSREEMEKKKRNIEHTLYMVCMGVKRNKLVGLSCVGGFIREILQRDRSWSFM